MSKKSKRDREQAKLNLKKFNERLRNKKDNMNVDECLANQKKLRAYSILMSCGCCYERVWFKNDGAISDAIARAGLSSSATITDDLGRTVSGVDAFYGFERDCT